VTRASNGYGKLAIAQNDERPPSKEGGLSSVLKSWLAFAKTSVPTLVLARTDLHVNPYLVRPAIRPGKERLAK